MDPRLLRVRTTTLCIRKRASKEIYTALKTGGLLAVWSAYNDPKFTKLLRKAGFDTSVVEVPAAHKGRKRRMHTIWLAKKGQ